MMKKKKYFNPFTFHMGTKNITESHYESVDVNEVVKAQKHLSVEQSAKLLKTFLK